MALTLNDISLLLKQEDELFLMELLGLTSEDIVNRFEDIITEKIEQLSEIYEDELAEETDDEK